MSYCGRLLQGAVRQQKIYKVTVPYSESCIRRQMSLKYNPSFQAFHCWGLNRGLKRQWLKHLLGMSGDPGGFLRRAASRMWAKGSWEEPRDQNIQGNSKEMLLPVQCERDTWERHGHKQSESNMEKQRGNWGWANHEGSHRLFTKRCKCGLLMELLQELNGGIIWLLIVTGGSPLL